MIETTDLPGRSDLQREDVSWENRVPPSLTGVFIAMRQEGGKI